MQSSYSRLQLTYYLFQIVKLGLLLAFSILAIGTGVGRWRFTLRALRGLMAKPTAEVTFTAKSCSGAKLHWHIIITRVGYMNGNGYRAFMIALFIDNASLGKSGTDLLSHLHNCLQIDRWLHMNPGLYIGL